jgi:hypothetical protein
VLEIRPTERKAEVRDGGEEREGERERERERNETNDII